MKIFSRLSRIVAALALCISSTVAVATDTFEQTKPLRLAVTSFKTCVEKSKFGQKEQANFDAMKKQMETILHEKEKALNDVAAKFNDIDYLDSLSHDAEAALKRDYRTITQEFNQQQNQFYQALSQANVAIIQRLTDAVTKASETVAKKNNIDVIFTDESCFYSIASIDISNLVIKVMDETFEQESKEGKHKAPSIE